MQNFALLHFLTMGMSSEEKAYRLLCLKPGGKTFTPGFFPKKRSSP